MPGCRSAGWPGRLASFKHTLASSKHAKEVCTLEHPTGSVDEARQNWTQAPSGCRRRGPVGRAHQAEAAHELAEHALVALKAVLLLLLLLLALALDDQHAVARHAHCARRRARRTPQGRGGWPEGFPSQGQQPQACQTSLQCPSRPCNTRDLIAFLHTTATSMPKRVPVPHQAMKTAP